jgi:hypothetical protein
MHVVLLGDSIFDNAAYTRGGPDVVTQLRELLTAGSQASLLAVDGAMTADVPSQLQRLPSDSSHLVLSVGGNDALIFANVLNAPADSVSRAVRAIADIVHDFEVKYRQTVAECLRLNLPLTLCTIYNGDFPDREFQRLASTVLAVFNDAILRIAIEHQLSVIDLRFVCSVPADYANPIEPSSTGGQKIARAIVLTTTTSVPEQGTRIIVD